MITPYQLDDVTHKVLPLYEKLENELFMQMASRLKTNPKYAESEVFKWHLEKLNELHLVNKDTLTTLSEITNTSVDEIIKGMREVGFASAKDIDLMMRDIKPIQPPMQHIDRHIKGFVNNALNDMDNYINQTLISTSYGNGTVALTYQTIIQESTSKVLAGLSTINDAVAETIVEKARKGLPSGFVDKAGRRWGVQEYVTMTIRSTTNNVYNNIRTERMDDYGIEFVSVSQHPAPRPACRPIQGGVASMREVSSDDRYPSIYEFGYGEAGGIRSANCKHLLFPFIPDINIQPSKLYDEAEAAETYELSQKQRYNERQIRKYKRDLKIAEELGNDKLIQRNKRNVSNWQERNREFVAKHNLPRQYARERVY